MIAPNTVLLAFPARLLMAPFLPPLLFGLALSLPLFGRKDLGLVNVFREKPAEYYLPLQSSPTHVPSSRILLYERTN